MICLLLHLMTDYTYYCITGLSDVMTYSVLDNGLLSVND